MVWVVSDITLGTSEIMPEKRLLPKIGGKNNDNFRLVQIFPKNIKTLNMFNSGKHV